MLHCFTGTATSVKGHVQQQFRAQLVPLHCQRQQRRPRCQHNVRGPAKNFPPEQLCRSQHGHAVVCRSNVLPEPIPADVQLELNHDAAAKVVTYDEDSKTVRIPLAAVTDGHRRTKLVLFTCSRCDGRSARLVNPVAWEQGAVFCQCQHCEVWHTLAAQKSIIDEVRYNDPEWELNQAQQEAAGEPMQEDSQQSTDTALQHGHGPDSDGWDGEVTSAATERGQ